MDRTPEGVIDFSQFKKKKEETELKPFFDKPTVVTLQDELGGKHEFNLLINIVYNDKQILVLEQHGTDNEVAIVEAVIENNALAGVQPVATEEEYLELVEIVQEAFAGITKEKIDEAMTDLEGDEDVKH